MKFLGVVSATMTMIIIVTPRAFAREDVRIGVIMDQTTNRVASEETIRGLQIGVDYLQGEQKGKFTLDLVDTGPLAAGTQKAMLEAVKNGKDDIIVAEIASSKAEVAAQIAEQYKHVMITPYATAYSVTQNRNFVFRACAIHDQQALGLAKRLTQTKKLYRGAIIYDIGQLYSVDLSTRMKDSFVKLGGKITMHEGILSSSESFSDTIKRLSETKPDFVFLPMYEDVTARFITELLHASSENPEIIGGDGWQNGPLFNSVVLTKNPNAKFSYITHHNPIGKSALQVKFETLYLKRFGAKPSTSGAYLAFDTMLIIGKVFPIGSNKTQDAVRERVAKTEGLIATTGTISFNGHQEPQGKTLYLNHMRGSMLESVEELRP